ncbi:MAG: hypothetical protein PF542_03265 [Nanoarchaeota archaeon]|jgi:hypothetical protein|nr:hypothetical protein [Nanoarchaeota archaeon]
MVLQYRKKSESAYWKDYHGKGKIEGQPQDYDFRLLSHDKREILADKGSYEKVLKRMRQIEFFKHKKGQGRSPVEFLGDE